MTRGAASRPPLGSASIAANSVAPAGLAIDSIIESLAAAEILNLTRFEALGPPWPPT